MSDTPLVKNGKLFVKSGSLVLPSDYDTCICCLDECSGICTGKCWTLEVIGCYWVSCPCGVCHDWSFSCGASATMALPDFVVPCKRNGEIVRDRHGASGTISVTGLRATRTCTEGCSRCASRVTINSYTGGGRISNIYCANSYIDASMSGDGPKLVGKNCLASGSIGFSASSTGCACDTGKPGQICYIKVELSGGAQATIGNLTVSSSTTVTTGFPDFKIF